MRQILPDLTEQEALEAMAILEQYQRQMLAMLAQLEAMLEKQDATHH